MASQTPAPQRKKLDSWKEIADYLARDVRTAMRWETDLGLPVRRVPGGKRRAVFAFRDEIDAWLQTRSNSALPVVPSTFRESRAKRIQVLVILCLLLLVAFLLASRRTSRSPATELVFELPGKRFHFLSRSIALNGSAGQIQAGDLNSDGLPDLVVGGATTGKLAVLLNHNGIFDQARYLASCAGSQAPAVADFDGDGNADIAVGCTEESTLEIWWGDGKGNLVSPKRWNVGHLPVTTAAVDLNRDRIADIVVGSAGGGPLVVFLGSHTREPIRREFPIQQPNGPVLMDLDSDGVLDIVVGSVLLSSSQFVFLRGHGDGTFDAPAAIPAGCHAWRVAALDLTSDGVPELVGSSADGDLTMLRGKGHGSFYPARSVLRSTSPQLIYPFAARKKNYVLNLQFFPGVGRLIEFNEQGVASVSNAVKLARNPRFLVTADFNNDGLTDIAVIGFDNESTELNVLLQTSNN